MTFFNGSMAAATSSTRQGSSSRRVSPVKPQDVEDDLVSRSSSPRIIDRKGKGKERMVEFALEPTAVNDKLEGGSEDDEREFRDASDTEDEDEDEENYEAERQRRIRENQLILAELGIEPSGSNSNIAGPSSSSSNIKQNANSSPQPHATSSRKRRNAGDIPIYDRSGYILSLPPKGQTHTMTCIEIPSDRKLKKRILDGEYTDCSHWMEGEARRWKFGFGKGGDNLPENEPEDLVGVTKEFRWRRWRGLERELRREMKQRGELVEMDARPVERVIPEGVSAYSLIPGESCHQCRRKSDKPKMKCRNVNPICRATFCETCCKRYSYFDFDEESRSFICPLCKDCCNCSNCIRKKNLAHLLGASKGKIQRKSLKYAMGADAGDQLSVQAWLEKAVKDVSKAPFDLIRIVDQDKDIISPETPLVEEEEIGETIVVEKPKAKRARMNQPFSSIEKKVKVHPPMVRQDDDGVDKPKAKRGRKKKVVDANEEEIINNLPERKQVKTNTKNLIVKLKIPRLVANDMSMRPVAHAERVKEVDSDGDTVGDWSDDEAIDGNDDSPLTSLSSLPSESPRPPPRLPFPPRPIYAPIMNVNTDGYLSSLPGVVQDQPFAQPTANSSDVVISSPTRENTAGLVSPLHSRSSPENGDEHSHPRKRKRPPPRANILRPPRHSSFSTSQSSPPGTHDELDHAPPPILSIDNGGPRNLTGDGSMQSAAPQLLSATSSQSQRIDIGPPPLLSSMSTLTPSSNHQMGYWQSRSVQGFDQTLYPQQQLPSISPSSSFLPIDYSSSYNTYASLYNGSGSESNYLGNMGLGGPPPYSHSPPSGSGRRSLVLSSNTERQYLRMNNHTSSSVNEPRTISPNSLTLPLPNIKGKPMNVGSNLSYLGVLSTAAEIKEDGNFDNSKNNSKQTE
ncbi:hypothetical protein I203_105980 [Kwoniella mangroviensis CBS 8507]|uniref:uncharacterized protein n=1 Tax=Kwoniella mangroviensis CBS 8507 TaxID=1296122 RepID=UPI00080D0F33|nr:uncharacterized protein I203_04457 [Kwoniella mangroviensis CBS 8507]OCF66131.1 hypothetical protein I203_04457 [Kwoniella mangroviensis CBS 8507]